VGVVELLEDRCEPNREGRGIRTMMKRLMRGPDVSGGGRRLSVERARIHRILNSCSDSRELMVFASGKMIKRKKEAKKEVNISIGGIFDRSFKQCVYALRISLLFGSLV
jgi:hypothetical protein